MMRTAAIFNPSAAKGRSLRKLDQVKNCLDREGIEHDLVFTQNAGHAEILAEKLVRDGYECIISIGGDGTLNEIVNGIIKANGNPVLGIIPVGTCNDFVKSFNIPSRIDKACAIIRHGNVASCDIAQVGNRYFINAIGIGFDVAVVEELQNSRVLRGFMSYLMTAVKNAFRYKGLELFIRNGQNHFSRKTLMIAIANGRYYGGGFKIAPHANASDGFLDVIIINNMSSIKRLFAIPRFLNGSHIHLPETEVFKTVDLTIKSDQRLTCQVEGELFKWTEPEIDIKLLPQRIRIFTNDAVH